MTFLHIVSSQVKNHQQNDYKSNQMTPDVDGLIVDVEERSEYGFDG